MVSPLDEYPLHQVPLPVTWAGTSDRNFYDRCYFNAHDRTGDIFLITGLGYYPNLGTKDAFVLVRRGDEQTAVHLGDAIDDDRLDQHVGGYRIEVRRARCTSCGSSSRRPRASALDLTWEGSFDVLQEQPHVMRAGSRVTLDAQRFAQVGTWSGTLADRRRGDRRVTRTAGSAPATARGGSGRSARPSPQGAPADPPFEGMWWLYVPMRFEEYAVVLIIQEDPDGYRTLNDCHRVWRDGRVEQLGWPQVDIHYASGTRVPTGASITCTTPDGKPLQLEVESLLPVPLHVGGGYGGDPDWTHGQWKGAGFTERVTYDLTDESVAGRDHVRRHRPRRPRRLP